MTKNKPKFLRTDSHKYSRLGIRRKKKQVYRKSKGRDNKIRLKMKGHLRNVNIGFRTKKSTRGLIKGLNPVQIFNLEDLKKIKTQEIGIIAKIGDKKKKEIADYALKNNIKLKNLDPKEFLDKLEENSKKIKKEKEARQEKKKERDKKTKEKKEKDNKKEVKLEEKLKQETKEENKEMNIVEQEEVIKNIESDVKENMENKK